MTPALAILLLLIDGLLVGAVVMLWLYVLSVRTDLRGCLDTVKQLQMPHRQAGDVPVAPHRERGW